MPANSVTQLALLWGKTSPDDPSRRHPLLYHLLDTAAVAQALWESSFGSALRQLFCDALRLDVSRAGRLLSWWIGLHDLGKASPAFQCKSTEAAAELQAAGLDFPRRLSRDNPYHHNLISARVLPEQLRGEPWLYPPGVAASLAKTLGGHHGSFPTARELLRLRGREREIGIGPWRAMRVALVEELARLCDTAGLDWRPPIELEKDQAFWMALAGLTSLADWLASATGHFFGCPDAPRRTDSYQPWAAERARELITERLIWKRWPETATPSSFNEVFPGLEPFPLQQRVAAMAEELSGPALVIIESPMGEGKTEAALYLADHWLRRPGCQGLYFALPTMATANQMFERVKDYLAKRLPGGRHNLHLLHSRASMVDEYKRLKPTGVGDDLCEDSGLVAAEWFSHRKHGLLSPFAVGTVDQALMAVLQVRHVFVRLFGLTGKVVIIDEVHAYDTYMSGLLGRLLRWLGALGAPVVLLSATLPRERRSELLEAYGALVSKEDVPTYPRISLAVPGTPLKVEHITVSEERCRKVLLEQTTPDPATMAEKLAELLGAGGCGAVICNTVGRAQEAYLALRERLDAQSCLLIHSRFPFAWRREKELQAERLFGKPSDSKVQRPHQRHVLVGTQVLEQSLDLDFDVMVTDLAPVDLVLQRMGRLHRHQRPLRPGPLSEPQLLVMWPEGDADHPPDFGPSKYVYEPYILLRTWLALGKRSRIDVPGDLERLIEEVYGEGCVEPSVAGLEEQRRDLERRLENERFMARRNAIPEPRRGSNIFEEVQYLLLDGDDPRVAAKIQALTRLSGSPSLQIVCLREEEGRQIPLVGGGTRPDDALDLDALMKSSFPLVDRRIVGPLLEELKNGRQPPALWRKTPLLRYTYPLVFTDKRAKVGPWVLELDYDLGLRVIAAGDEG